ncbi:hypothetical protein [Hominenteromicrobium sp.]|uniref:hypothetical protein n=1 Tax=Hominenteromicrobium sp. TaxID=3073581 RepID=UPI003AB29262
MKNNHEIILKQYAAYCKEQPLYLGTAGSYGMEMLTIIREGVWAEYDILAAFHPPVGAAVQVRVGANNQIGVPIEATAEKGMGEIVFAGYKEGVRQIAVDVLYKVAPSSGASGTEPAEPTPDVVQQILSAANGAVKTADGVREDMDKMLEAESKRAAAEQVRVKAESTRAAAETARKDAESFRVKAEAEREKQLPALKSSVDELRARQNILVGSETGNPISVDDAFAAPLCGLTVYGKSTQDGAPTPDAPVPIVSAGDGGSVALKVTGANILDMRNSKESNTNSGVTYTRNADYSFTRTGTATDIIGNVWTAGGYKVKPNADLSNVFCVLLKGVKYSIKDCILFTISLAGGPLTAKGQNFVPVQDMYITGVRNEEFVEGKTYNDIVYPAVYVGAKVLQYEPYREQLLTLPTPTGLPGIPVTSGGNYTDQSGQQWVCDEVDLARGVKVQRIDTAALDSAKPLTEQNATLSPPIETPLTSDEISAYKALTAYGPDTVVQASDGAGIRLDYQRDLNLVVKNLEDAIASMTIT